MAPSTWKPHDSLTQAPTNLKEAIDWVLRVTGKDGKKNVAAQPPPPPGSTNNGPHCLCYLAKAVKDLLYDAKDPGTPGPSPKRNWDDILLGQEKDIVKPVLTDLGLVSTGSSAARDTCAGGTEVIRTLIDQLAQGLQKWVGWRNQGDECCLKGEGGRESKGIGRKCDCKGGPQCCGTSGSSATTCHECGTCGKDGNTKCYQSAYNKDSALWTNVVNGTPGSTVNTVKAAQEVHLLARIFLGSVCLIWSGLSQLGFLTGNGKERWSQDGKLHEEQHGLGSFMAAMGYDLERLNGSGVPGPGKKGQFVHDLLTKDKTGVPWKEFKNGDAAQKKSVAEYYSSIYGAVKETKTETLCEKYPLLVLHILASGYFRAGSAGANKVTVPAKPASSTTSATPSSRKPRTIREILYWLSALPYSEKYRDLVDRLKEKCPKEGIISLEGTGNKTDLKKDCITHYLMAACGYCPLVLIGIQGTINTSGTDTDSTTAGSAPAAAEKKPCPKHKDNPRNGRCQLEKSANTDTTKTQSTNELTEGQVCYGGYHLDVSQFGPLHGMYANGLYGFDMGGSAAQCLDQLRVYVYHCFYQLYFLRKQCGTAVLGWKSCRYGSGVSGNTNKWACETKSQGTSNGDHSKQCGVFDGARSVSESALQSFLCDSLNKMNCTETIGKDLSSGKQSYPEIEDHMNMQSPFHPNGHLKEQCGHCPVPMGWKKETDFKDLTTGSHKTAALDKGTQKYPVHCTGNTLSHLLEYYCDPVKCHGTLVVLLRLLACITPTVPRTLGDLFGFYYYIVYIGGKQGGGQKEVNTALGELEREVVLHMGQGNAVVTALKEYGGDCSSGKEGHLKCLTECANGTGAKYLSPLSGQQYGQLSPLMAGTYLSWLVYLIGEFEGGLNKLKEDYMKINCKESDCKSDGCQGVAGNGCGNGTCTRGTHGNTCDGSSGGVCGCTSVVSCTGVLPVLYRYGFGYGNVEALHDTAGGAGSTQKKCHEFLDTLKKVLEGDHLKKDGTKGGLHHEINQLIYTTRLPWIFVLTLAWLVAVLYLAFGAIWPLDWTHMRSHCRGWFGKGSLSPWEILMVGKKKGRGILEFFGGM